MAVNREERNALAILVGQFMKDVQEINPKTRAIVHVIGATEDKEMVCQTMADVPQELVPGIIEIALQGVKKNMPETINRNTGECKDLHTEH